MPPKKPLVADRRLKVGRKICGDYEVVKTLGKGTYGEVSLVKSEKGSSYAAKKSIRMMKLRFGDIPETDFYIEVDMLLRFNHPNLMRAENYYYSNLESCAILDVAETDLANYIDTYHQFSKHPPGGEAIFLGCCRGLAYLHANHVIHRDLKPQNILLFKGVPKISDFGAAKTTFEPLVYKYPIITSWWRPPELFYEPVGYPYGFEVDVWSMLMIGAEILFMLPPYGSEFGDARNDVELAIALDSAGTYIPDRLKSLVPASFDPQTAPLDVMMGIRQGRPELGIPVDPDFKANYPQAYELCTWMAKAIAARPSDRPTAEQLYDKVLEVQNLSKPKESLSYRSSKVGYEGHFNPETRKQAAASFGRTLPPRTFLLAMDIFDRVSTKLNKPTDLDLNQKAAMFLADVILGDGKLDRTYYDFLGFSWHLGKVLDALDFHIYRPDMVTSLGIEVEQAVALAKRTLSPEDVTV